MHILIRRVKTEDLDKIAGLEEKYFSQPWSREAFENAALNDDYILLAAEHEGEIAGYVCSQISVYEADIMNIAVKEEYRRMGIATKLIEVLAQESAKRGAESIFLEVRLSNKGAIETYKRNGFTEVGTRRNFYEKPTEDALIMRKGLP